MEMIALNFGTLNEFIFVKVCSVDVVLRMNMF